MGSESEQKPKGRDSLENSWITPPERSAYLVATGHSLFYPLTLLLLLSLHQMLPPATELTM